MMATLVAVGLLLLSSGCALGQQSVTSAYIRPSSVPLLPLDHERLSRTADSPHDPEQIQLALAGPGAMAISWVSNPQVNSALSILTTSLVEGLWKGRREAWPNSLWHAVLPFMQLQKRETPACCGIA